MFGTIFSIVIGGLLIFIPPAKEILPSMAGVSFLLIGVSLLMLLSATIALVISWSPLQKIEQNLTPRLIDLFSNDKQVFYFTTFIFMFPLFTLIICSELAYFHYFRPVFGIGLWTILFGLSIDALLLLIRRILSYLNPFSIVNHFTNQAIESIQEEEDIDLLHWIDALSEIGVKAVTRTLPSLAMKAIDDLQEICHTYLESAKSIAHHNTERTAKDLGGTDKVSYTLFYLFQRLELINEKALDQRMEPICSHLVTTLGKVSISAAHFDISLASYPLHYIGKFAGKAQDEEIDEVTEKATCTLLEVGRIILEEVDVRYLDIKEPFLCIIQHMEEFAKYTFSQDKSININILTQPFHEMKVFFDQDKVANHQDTPTIVSDLDRVINQFDQLELVMKTIPRIDLPDEIEDSGEGLSDQTKKQTEVTESPD
ncbi:MAG: hypothetical protein AAGG81_02995 [Chlamydiota bacterium]